VASQVFSQVSLSPAGASRQRAEWRRAQRGGFGGSCRLLSARASSVTSRRSQVRALHRPSLNHAGPCSSSAKQIGQMPLVACRAGLCEPRPLARAAFRTSAPRIDRARGLQLADID
jgi:hypothetical protein